MNKNLLLVLTTLLFCGACKKNDGRDIQPLSAADSAHIIKGLCFFDIDAQAVGKIGQPDDILEAHEVKLDLFPNPAQEELRFVISTRNTQDTAFTYQIAHVSYPAAPDSLQIYQGSSQSIMLPVIVKNGSSIGQEVVRQAENIPEVAGRRSILLAINLQNYLKGFYRLFIETNTGVRLWVAFYKY